MNERTKELALQAEAQYCDLSDASIFKRLGLTDAVVFRLTDLEKFADLVVTQEREACADICIKMANRCDDIRKAALEVAAENIIARGTT